MCMACDQSSGVAGTPHSCCQERIARISPHPALRAQDFLAIPPSGYQSCS
jgi:hypothetical protein